MSGATNTSTRLDFRSGGWVLLASGVVALGLVAFALSGVFFGAPRVGDGRHPESYGFAIDLPDALAPGLAASGNPRDFLPPLHDPATIPASEVDTWNESHRMRVVVSADAVVGLTVNGESRAWPVPLLNVHEIVHDSIGGIPICITWSPLTRTAVAFDRRIAGRERRFALSGLLCFGTMLMYDATEQPAQSLWSPVAFRAVSGPAQQAGEALVPLPGLALCSWQAWEAAHPDSTVALAPASDKQRIKETSYARWYGQRALPAGVTSEDPLRWKHPIVAIRTAADSASPWLEVQLPEGSSAAGFVAETPLSQAGSGVSAETIPPALASPNGFIIMERPLDWLVIPSCEGAWRAFHSVASQSDR